MKKRRFVDDAWASLFRIWSQQPNFSGASRSQAGTREGLTGLKVGKKVIRFQLNPCDTVESIVIKLGLSPFKKGTKYRIKLLEGEEALAFIQKQPILAGEKIIPRIELVDENNPNLEI